MSKQALVFDVGNTRIKWGIAEDDELVRDGSISHAQLRIGGFEALLRHLPRDVDYALASNVAGQDFGSRLARAVGIHIGGDLRFVRSEYEGFGIRNGYLRPRQLGADRWAAMVGAWAEFGSAVCIVDAGTALIIDALDDSGQHLGGQIIPGLKLLADSLAADTSDIPPSTLEIDAPTEPANWFAQATDEAVAVGALNALCGAVERAVARLHDAGLSPEIVLTGGDATRILEVLGGLTNHRPNLVLAGLVHMLPGEAG